MIQGTRTRYNSRVAILCVGRRFLPVLVASLALAWLSTGRSQADAAGQVKGGQVFQTSVELVNVTATVTDQDGRLIGTLDRDAFTIHENGIEQEITQFYQGRVPVSMGILLDVSDSMRGQRMEDARFALARFVTELLEPTDEVFLASFNHAPQLVAPWTTPPSDVGRPLDTVQPFGGTAIYDAMQEAIPRFRTRTHQRAAVLLISDGSDTASDANVRDIKRQLRRSDAFVYAIAIDDEEKRPINDPVNEFTLMEMTDESGGYTEVIHSIEDLGPATARIAEELNQQYMLGYTSTDPPDSKFRAIRVRTRNSNYTVRARKGYTAVPAAERRNQKDR